MKAPDTYAAVFARYEAMVDAHRDLPSDYRDYSTAYDQAYRSALRLMGVLS
jgi:hypothetical protein